MKPQRRQSWSHFARTLVPVATIAVLLGAGTPVGASTPSTVALRIADYAVATASHDSPPHVVTAADLNNAVGINTVNTSSLTLVINVGDEFGYSRLVLFVSPTSFTDTCLNLPDKVGGAPKVVVCSRQARGLWDSRAGAIAVSDRAIAAAATMGHAVSGTDVVAAAKVYHETLRPKPTFLAGQGGKVEFATLVEMGLNTKFTVDNCVQLPKTAYGIPVSVPC
jgi:hypothetical protein